MRNVRLVLLGGIVAASAHATSTFTVGMEDSGSHVTLSQSAKVNAKLTSIRFDDAFGVDLDIDRNPEVQDAHSPTGASMLAGSLLTKVVPAIETAPEVRPKPMKLIGPKTLTVDLSEHPTSRRTDQP